jgi:hypothetical protein
MEDKPVPTWQKWAAAAYVLAIVAEIVVFHTHLHTDFIPFDNSHIAPNILASIIIVEVVTPFGVLLWPPTERRLHRFVDRKIAPLHAKLAEHEQRHAEHADKLDALKASLDLLHAKHDAASQSKGPK